MESQEIKLNKESGLDTFIKVLTIIKLLVQLAFYGVLLGGTLYFLLNNPIPELINGIQENVMRSFIGG